MLWFGPSLRERVESLRNAENKLLELAKNRFGARADQYELRSFDTAIPQASVPLQSHGCEVHTHGSNGSSSPSSSTYKMHAVQVENKTGNREVSKTPLVLLHGYMNGAAYFYRNLIGLSSAFQSVFALDMLGWGLSSRPKFRLLDTSVRTTQDFFVESLEAWRKANQLDRMILAGHSMGGYLSVAYAERYPERVERLILASPVGVPEETPDMVQQRISRRQSSWRGRLFWAIWSYCFAYKSPGEVIRMFPSGRGRRMVQEYVRRRLPAIDREEEQFLVADYLYQSATGLPGSGEYCVNKILTESVHAREPLVHRIPKLKVSHVSFLYGANDWMDSSGGLDVQVACEAEATTGAPKVEVFQVSDAGHLLMLDNWKEFNAGVILSAGGKLPGNQNINKFCPIRLEAATADDVSDASAEFVSVEHFRKKKDI